MSKHFLVAPDQEIVNQKLPQFTDNLLGDDSRKDIADALEKEMVKVWGIRFIGESNRVAVSYVCYGWSPTDRRG